MGRGLSSLFVRVGYWSPRNQKHQAWSDQIAGTIVKLREVDQAQQLAFVVIILISFLIDATATLYALNGK